LSGDFQSASPRRLLHDLISPQSSVPEIPRDSIECAEDKPATTNVTNPIRKPMGLPVIGQGLAGRKCSNKSEGREQKVENGA
jgi:hypothetical protein